MHQLRDQRGQRAEHDRDRRQPRSDLIQLAHLAIRVDDGGPVRFDRLHLAHVPPELLQAGIDRFNRKRIARVARTGYRPREIDLSRWWIQPVDATH